MISEIHNCDCMEYMKTIPDNWFDLAIADPPYGIGISSNPVRQKHQKKDWDNQIINIDYFNSLFRVSKNQIIWGGNYYNEFIKSSKGFIIWDKQQPFDFSLAMCEYAWSSYNIPAKMFRYSVLKEHDKIHPTQKPVKLYAWILKNYAKEGDRIFDPMMGSGSSRIAAYKLGFDFYGCEIDKDYFEASNERFELECKGVYHTPNGEYKQLDLF